MNQTTSLLRFDAADPRRFYVDFGKRGLRTFTLEPLNQFVPEQEIEQALITCAKHVSSLGAWSAIHTTRAVNRFSTWCAESGNGKQLVESRNLAAVLQGDAWTNVFTLFRQHAATSGWQAREITGLCSRALLALHHAGLSVPNFDPQPQSLPGPDGTGCISVRIPSSQALARTIKELSELCDALGAAGEDLALTHLRGMSKNPKTRTYIDIASLSHQLRLLAAKGDQ